MTATLQEWRRGGETAVLAVGGAQRKVFIRRTGSGPTVVLLHGFPASSFE